MYDMHTTTLDGAVTNIKLAKYQHFWELNSMYLFENSTRKC